MRTCKIYEIEKILGEYTSYKNYSAKFRPICKDCKNKKAKKRGQKLRKNLI